MNGYEFTKPENNFIKQVPSKSFDASTIALKIEYNNSTVDLRNDADYVSAKDWFIETTLSCSKEEAIKWMEYYMSNAIAYGIKTKNLDWRTKFLAAWDLFNSLTA